MPISNNRRARLHLSFAELAFVQNLLKADYHFITEEEQKTRQAFVRKFSDITLPGGQKGGVDLYFTQLEITFLQKLTKTAYSFLTLAEQEARQELRQKIRLAWEEVSAVGKPAGQKA